MGQLAVAASASVAAAIAIAATVFGQKQKANPMNVQNFSISIWKGQHREAKKCVLALGGSGRGWVQCASGFAAANGNKPLW